MDGGTRMKYQLKKEMGSKVKTVACSQREDIVITLFARENKDTY